MGLKPIRSVDGNGCRTDANMWFKLNHDLWSNYALMPFQASADAKCPEPDHLKKHWNCLEYPRDTTQTDKPTNRVRIRKTDGQTDSEKDSDRQRKNLTDRQKIRQTQKQSDRQTQNKSDRQTQVQTTDTELD